MSERIDDQSPNSDTVTRDVRIEAAAQYLPDESDPERKQYLYMYRVRVTNEGKAPVKLHARHWIIIDANNDRQEIVGQGVVGKQPELAPGEMFQYTSSCPLTTNWGTMEGFYTFTSEASEPFQVEVGRFFLVPSVDNALV